MKIDIFTIFPEMINPLFHSILGKANDKGLINIQTTDIREFTLNKHNKVDDYPFGGGVGMLMQVEPITRAMEAREINEKTKVIYMSPRGKLLDEALIKDLASEEHIAIVCGHYEGIDERAIEYWNMQEVSIGDYILTGGEPAAIVLVDAVCRMIPGVLGDEVSVSQESIYGGLLEYPQYTKPRDFRDMKVPEILLSGHHKNIKLWQFEESLKITKENRPDLFEKFLKNKDKLTKEEKKIVDKIIKK